VTCILPDRVHPLQHLLGILLVLVQILERLVQVELAVGGDVAQVAAHKRRLERLDRRLLRLKQLEQRRQLVLHVAQLEQRRRVLPVFPFRPLQLPLVASLDGGGAIFLGLVFRLRLFFGVHGGFERLEPKVLHVLRHSLGLEQHVLVKGRAKSRGGTHQHPYGFLENAKDLEIGMRCPIQKHRDGVKDDKSCQV